MKNTLLLFCCLSILMKGSAQNPVLNYSFENWSLGDPTYWLTNNSIAPAPLITQENGGYTGNFAVKGEVINNSGTPMAPVLYSAPNGGQSGFPMTIPYTTLNFYYKFFPAISGDQLYSYINVQNINGNGIASGFQAFGNSTSVFTLASVPVNYVSTDPTNLELSFSIINSGGANIGVGSWFIMDEMSMGNTSAVEELATNHLKNPYPNPAIDRLNIPFHIENPGEISIQIFDLHGRKLKELISSTSLSSDGKIIEDVSDLSSGLYQCVMTDGSNRSAVLFGVK